MPVNSSGVSFVVSDCDGEFLIIKNDTVVSRKTVYTDTKQTVSMLYSSGYGNMLRFTGTTKLYDITIDQPFVFSVKNVYILSANVSGATETETENGFHYTATGSTLGSFFSTTVEGDVQVSYTAGSANDVITISLTDSEGSVSTQNLTGLDSQIVSFYAQGTNTLQISSTGTDFTFRNGAGRPNVVVSGGQLDTDYRIYQQNEFVYAVFLTENIDYTLTTDSSTNIDYFVVGGGGAGGGGGGDNTFSRSASPNTGGASGGNGKHGAGGGGGGGGGGGVKEGTEANKPAGSYTIVVGKGQTLNSGTQFVGSTSVNSATDSSFDNVIAGRGAAGVFNYSGAIVNGTNGGGGGGGGYGLGAGGTSDTGGNGGRNSYTSPSYPGGGGGGAGTDGTDANTTNSIASINYAIGGDGKKPLRTNMISAINYINAQGVSIGELVEGEYWFGGGGGGGSFSASYVGGAGGKGGGTQGSPGGQTTAGLGGSGVVVLVISNT